MPVPVPVSLPLPLPHLPTRRDVRTYASAEAYLLSTRRLVAAPSTKPCSFGPANRTSRKFRRRCRGHAVVSHVASGSPLLLRPIDLRRRLRLATRPPVFGRQLGRARTTAKPSPCSVIDAAILADVRPPTEAEPIGSDYGRSQSVVEPPAIGRATTGHFPHFAVSATYTAERLARVKKEARGRSGSSQPTRSRAASPFFPRRKLDFIRAYGKVARFVGRRRVGIQSLRPAKTIIDDPTPPNLPPTPQPDNIFHMTRTPATTAEIGFGPAPPRRRERRSTPAEPPLLAPLSHPPAVVFFARRRRRLEPSIRVESTPSSTLLINADY